jgi:hypothetical protein
VEGKLRREDSDLYPTFVSFVTFCSLLSPPGCHAMYIERPAGVVSTYHGVATQLATGVPRGVASMFADRASAGSTACLWGCQRGCRIMFRHLSCRVPQGCVRLSTGCSLDVSSRIAARSSAVFAGSSATCLGCVVADVR